MNEKNKLLVVGGVFVVSCLLLLLGGGRFWQDDDPAKSPPPKAVKKKFDGLKNSKGRSGEEVGVEHAKVPVGDKDSHQKACGCATCQSGDGKKADAAVRTVVMDRKFQQGVFSRQQKGRISFPLPGGAKASGRVQQSRVEAGELVMVQGRLESPHPGFFFFQKQSLPGVAGEMVGVVRFDKGDVAYRVEPGEDGKPVLAEHRADDVFCRNYAPVPEQGAEEIPADHPDNVGIPAYQNGVIPLQSLPGATGVVYLDFDGEEGPHNGWGDFDAAPANANNAQIKHVWERVAEDFAPFNLNVTTDLQVYLDAPENSRIRCIVTPTTNAAPGAGGVAYVGSYNWTGDTPCWGFYSTGKSAAEVISHEIGHTLGLSHDGRTTPSEGYYGGHGSGEVGWAPIMGVGYYKNLSQWSKGEYLNANQTQDDLAIITGNNNNVDYRQDDHGDSLATASYLEVLADDSVSNQGVIETGGDLDGFRFETSGGSVSLTIGAVSAGPNVDLLAEIVDSSGSVVVSDNPDTLVGATVSANLAAGEYFLRVSGVGRGDVLGDGYTDYGSLGYYTVSGNVAGAVKPDRFSIAENSANGTPVGTVTPRNNHGGAALGYAIASGNSSGAFSLDGASGALSVADVSQLDYEVLSGGYDDPARFELFVDITNSSNTSLNETVRVVVTLTDVNEAHSIVGPTQKAIIGSSVGEVVADFSISGEDYYYTNNPNYSITSGNGSGAFAISNSGRLTVASVDAFMNEEQHVLVISAVDGPSGSQMTATHTITVISQQRGVHSDFTESSLAAVNGLYLDIPNTSVASVTLDAANDELDLTTTGSADMWTQRANAPIAYAVRPEVALGDTWYAETHMRLNGTSGVQQQRIAGLTLYPAKDGAGGSSGGMEWSVGLNEWDNRGVEVQGFGGGYVGNSGSKFINPSPQVKGISEVYLRMEVTENGVYDYYRIYYKQTAAGPWIQFAEFDSKVDNTRVGLFMKNGNIGSAERSVSFRHFRVGRLGVDTGFQEAGLARIPGLSLDVPNASVAAVNLDKPNNELDLTTSGPADMWTQRANAPIAYARKPEVNSGDTWYAETHVKLNGTSGIQQQRIAGLVFYPDQDGAGGSSGGMEWSVELNEWDNRGVEVQGFGNGNVGDTGSQYLNPSPQVKGLSEVFFRVEVTENGASDAYKVYYKQTAGASWIQFASFNSSTDNSRVGLFMKNGNIGAAERSVSFKYFKVGKMLPQGVDTDFTESALGAIKGLGIDIPNTAVAAMALDTANDELDLTTTGSADMWTQRANAPIAYARRPEVSAGDAWYAETHMRLNGTAQQQPRIAGLLFYPDQDGAGGSSNGMEWSVELNEWNNRGVEVQGFGGLQVGDSGSTFINPSPQVTGLSEVFFRVEVTENGASDAYRVYYKQTAGASWIQFASFNSSVDNSRIGLFIKNGNIGAAERSVSFKYFKVAKYAAPVVSDASFSVAENSANGTVVGTVNATDADSGQTLSYAITAGNTGNAFAINSSTGVITTAGALDYETLSSYTLTVQATDNGTPALSGTGTVTIAITDDINEDSDNDGLTDSWEITHFGNLTAQTGNGDADSDGISNSDEQLFGTDPNLSSSKPRLVSLDFQGDGSSTGFYGQLGTPILMNGAHSVSGLGSTWNAANGTALNSNPANLVVNPSWTSLSDSAGGVTGVDLSITGSVSFWSGYRVITGDLRVSDDYVIFKAAGTDASVTFALTGLTANANYKLYFYGGTGSNRVIDVSIGSLSASAVNKDGQVLTVTSDAQGQITGTVSTPSANAEGNWSGLQIQGN